MEVQPCSAKYTRPRGKLISQPVTQPYPYLYAYLHSESFPFNFDKSNNSSAVRPGQCESRAPLLALSTDRFQCTELKAIGKCTESDQRY